MLTVDTQFSIIVGLKKISQAISTQKKFGYHPKDICFTPMFCDIPSSIIVPYLRLHNIVRTLFVFSLITESMSITDKVRVQTVILARYLAGEVIAGSGAGARAVLAS